MTLTAATINAERERIKLNHTLNLIRAGSRRTLQIHLACFEEPGGPK